MHAVERAHVLAREAQATSQGLGDRIRDEVYAGLAELGIAFEEQPRGEPARRAWPPLLVPAAVVAVLVVVALVWLVAR